MTGAELAQKLNISQQQISRYERGVSRISADMLLHILSIFNVSVNDFFERVSNRVVTLKYKIKYDKDNKVPFLNVGFLKEVYDVKN
ncbi:MrpJ family protein [Proteus myxofaciens ATCC 19692]|uniref:MrpJ family protein n=2 Tax=Proteus myxofaciens TaxID=184072 RepID=A0A198GL11_9GAMM|nr:MrpJ family protein [Proteus myxofaciens ATCC 19692]